MKETQSRACYEVPCKGRGRLTAHSTIPWPASLTTDAEFCKSPDRIPELGMHVFHIRLMMKSQREAARAFTWLAVPETVGLYEITVSLLTTTRVSGKGPKRANGAQL